MMQVKVPTWFLTLSAADMYWPELAIAAGLVETKEAALALSKMERLKLIADNPVLTADLFMLR